MAASPAKGRRHGYCGICYHRQVPVQKGLASPFLGCTAQWRRARLRVLLPESPALGGRRCISPRTSASAAPAQTFPPLRITNHRADMAQMMEKRQGMRPPPPGPHAARHNPCRPRLTTVFPPQAHRAQPPRPQQQQPAQQPPRPQPPRSAPRKATPGSGTSPAATAAPSTAPTHPSATPSNPTSTTAGLPATSPGTPTSSPSTTSPSSSPSRARRATTSSRRRPACPSRPASQSSR